MYGVSNCIINTKKSNNTEERKKRVKFLTISLETVLGGSCAALAL